MKTILSNTVLLLFCSTILTGCFGHCADFNCSSLNPRWEKKVHDCYSRNFDEVIKQQLGYQSRIEVQDSEIGQHISTQCIRNDGRYNVKKDKKYGHLFAKMINAYAVEKWGIPEKGADGKYINHAIPKLVYPNKPNGERYDEENPF